MTKLEKTESGWNLNDDGKIIPITKNPVKQKDGSYSQPLPENSSGRKWILTTKMVDGLELTEATQRSTSGSTGPKFKVEDYLDGKDKETYLELVKKAEEKFKSAEVDRIKSEIERLKKLIGEE